MHFTKDFFTGTLLSQILQRHSVEQSTDPDRAGHHTERECGVTATEEDHPMFVPNCPKLRPARALLVSCLALLAQACVTAPEKAPVLRQPSNAPVRTISSFTEALRCMDTMLWNHGKQDVFITANGIPDATGRIAGGTKEMLITAVSRMSARSQAFRFVDFEPNLDDVNALYWLIGVQPDFRAPSYYIRGAVTQLDESTIGETIGAGLSLPGLDIGVSADQVVSVISVDLNVGELVTRQILPGMSASNSIAVLSKGASGDAGGVIRKAGLSFNVSLNRSEGFHQALRTLIELSTIEALGKLTKVPYWQCLGIEATNPAFMSQARDWYDGMSERDRTIFAQRALQANGYYDGPLDGAPSQALADAVGAYQGDNDLIATGRVDFDLYYSMLAKAPERAMAPERNPARVEQTSSRPPQAPGGPAVPEITLSTDRGPRPQYRVGETVSVRAQLSSDGYLYCYYTDAQGNVARIFPNRFQPDAFVEGRRQIEIPPSGQASFNLRMDAPGSTETVACLAASRELGLYLPDRLKTEDLSPMPGVGLQEVVGTYQTLPGGNVRLRQLPITVRPQSGG